MREGEAGKAAAVRRHVGVFGERCACEEREGDAAGLVEGKGFLAGGGVAPAERAVEGTAAREVGDAEGDEADGLVHGCTRRSCVRPCIMRRRNVIAVAHGLTFM